MARVLLTALLGVLLAAGPATADDNKNTGKNDANKNNPSGSSSNKNASEKGQQAKITNVDTKNHTLTVKMKDKDGKEVERTFKMTEEVMYADSTGRVAAAEVFANGDDVVIVEADGKLKEVHKGKKHDSTSGTKTNSGNTNNNDNNKGKDK